MIEFQSAHPVRGATFFGFRILPAPLFQSTRPVWGATTASVSIFASPCISTPAPGVGRHDSQAMSVGLLYDFNPRAPCGARLYYARMAVATPTISIHAPRVGRDLHRLAVAVVVAAFQSTRPVWGATFLCIFLRPTSAISIHAPRVGRDRADGHHAQHESISIHAPRVGRDVCSSVFRRQHGQFQSTRPVWGATRGGHRLGGHQRYFNPRAPCGARRAVNGHAEGASRFQSTRPVWGATGSLPQIVMIFEISIHAPRVGRDTPQRGRRAPKKISIHAPRVGRDGRKDGRHGPI